LQNTLLLSPINTTLFSPEKMMPQVYDYFLFLPGNI